MLLNVSQCCALLLNRFRPSISHSAGVYFYGGAGQFIFFCQGHTHIQQSTHIKGFASRSRPQCTSSYIVLLLCAVQFLMDSTVTCRDIPLTCVAQWDSDGLEEGSFVAVHQLSAQLWKRFDTPRPSVQKKIEDLHISLLQCSRSQVEHLRRSGAIAGFRATIISVEDAERVCDELRRSREKRGLLKHPKIKRRKRSPRKGKMSSRMCAEGGSKPLKRDRAQKNRATIDSGQVEVVDRCASFGNISSPPPPPTPSLIVTPPVRNSPSQLSPPDSLTNISSCLNLPVDPLWVAGEKIKLDTCGGGHASSIVNDSQLSATSGEQSGEDLNALNLCVSAHKSHKMATLRSHLAARKEKPEKIKLIRPRSRDLSHRRSRNSSRLRHPPQDLSFMLEAPPTSSAHPSVSAHSKYPAVSSSTLGQSSTTRGPSSDKGLPLLQNGVSSGLTGRVGLNRLHHRRSERVPTIFKHLSSPQLLTNQDEMVSEARVEEARKASTSDHYHFRGSERTPSIPSRSRLCSPLLDNDLEETVAEISPPGEPLRKAGSSAERRKSERFLFLSSEEEEEVILVKVENKRASELKKQNLKPMEDGKAITLRKTYSRTSE